MPTTTENNHGLIETATYDTYQATPSSTGITLGNTGLPTTTQTTLGNTSVPRITTALPTANQGAIQTIGLPPNTQLNYTQNVNLPQTTTQKTIVTTTNQQPTTGLTTLSQPITTQIQNAPQTLVVGQNIQNPGIIQTTAQPQPIRSTLQYLTTPEGQVIQTQYGQKIFDEDFRRGRPMYNYERNYKLLSPSKNNNLPLRPIYNVGLVNNNNLLNYGYGNGLNTGIGLNRINALGNNNVNLAAGNRLDKLTKGHSYDVYGRGITPLLNKVGLGDINNANLPSTSKIKDFL